MAIKTTNLQSGTILGWVALSPEKDITAYDLWRCMMIGQTVRPDDAAGIPEDLRRHYKQRPGPGHY